MNTILSTTKPDLKKLLLVFLLAFSSLLYSQNEGKIWYFGSNAGLDFNTNPPTVLNDGQLNTLEGTASIADGNGNLLFYTDGVSAYTQNHTLMPNGAGGLGGNSSSAQSALIVPHPGNSNQFFLFTVSEFTHSNLFYSVIDMSLNNGLGDVVANTKALPVLNDTGEYLQATPSDDGSFWWVLTHKNGNADYYAYKVTVNGLELNQPVISSTGAVSSALGDIGFIKFNSLGDRMVRTSYLQDFFEISDFNNATGEVSNSIHIPFNGAYGAEFSPNNRFLYISGYSNLGLKQFDLDAGNTASNIQATAYTYSNQINGAIQIAPDGKIYSSRYGASALDVIQEPNQPGANANFQMNFQSLGSATAQLGLPNIITNLVFQTPPVAICHENITIELDEFGYALLTSEMVNNGSFDNSAIAEMFIDKTEFGCEDIGENTVTLTVVNVSGNSSTCTTIVYVQDSIAPEIFVELDSNIQQATINQPYILPDYYSDGSAWALDNCTTVITNYSQTPQPGTLLDAGRHLILLSAADESGNTATVSFHIIVETTLSTTDFTDTFDLSIYPNPTADYFKISNQNQLNIESVEIYDLYGRLLYRIQPKEFPEIGKVNVNHLATATYLIVIKSEGKTTTKKLIKR